MISPPLVIREGIVILMRVMTDGGKGGRRCGRRGRGGRIRRVDRGRYADDTQTVGARERGEIKALGSVCEESLLLALVLHFLEETAIGTSISVPETGEETDRRVMPLPNEGSINKYNLGSLWARTIRGGGG